MPGAETRRHTPDASTPAREVPVLAGTDIAPFTRHLLPSERRNVYPTGGPSAGHGTSLSGDDIIPIDSMATYIDSLFLVLATCPNICIAVHGTPNELCGKHTNQQYRHVHYRHVT